MGGAALNDGFNILVSFAERRKAVEMCLRPGFRVLLDSGAFANFNRKREVVTLDAYLGYLRERGSAFWRYFALDKVADQAASTRNLDRMLAAGLKPVPVFQRGGKLADLESLKGVSDLVGVGGVAGRLRCLADRAYLRQVIRAAKGHRLHLLGCGREDVLRAYRPYSADSSSHALRHGTVWLWHDRRFYTLRRVQGEVQLDRAPIKRQPALFARLCALYDVNPAAAMTQRFYGTNPAKIVNLRSFIRYQKELRRIGVEYFIACVEADVPRAIEAWSIEHANVHAAA